MRRKFGILSIVFGVALLIYTLVHATLYTGSLQDFLHKDEGSFVAPATRGTDPNIADSTVVKSELDRQALIPERLEIPKIKVNADVQQVGLTQKGNMGVPNNFTDVAWYKYGSAPGEIGSAVIDGHVDNALGLPGVFKHLADMAPGDIIFIDTISGERLQFQVTEVASYAWDQVPKDRVFNNSDGAFLNLITCDGTWIQKEKNYDKRLVVYSALVK